MTSLTEERERLISLLPYTDAGTEKYMNLLDAIERLVWLIDRIPSPKHTIEPPTMEPPVVSVPMESDCTVTVQEPEVQYTKEDVREILTDASKQGVKIQPIMQQFIPEGQAPKLSNIPASEYSALVEAINNAR